MKTEEEIDNQRKSLKNYLQEDLRKNLFSLIDKEKLKQQYLPLPKRGKQKLLTIQYELFLANCSIYYLEDMPDYLGIRGEIFSFTLERRSNFYRVFHNISANYDKNLFDKFIQKLFQRFINLYYNLDGFAFVFDILEEYTTRLYCRINNQFTLNLFVSYIKENENYIKINTL